MLMIMDLVTEVSDGCFDNFHILLQLSNILLYGREFGNVALHIGNSFQYGLVLVFNLLKENAEVVDIVAGHKTILARDEFGLEL